MTPSAADVARTLRRAKVARVASQSPSGTPALTPLWCVVHRGRVVLTTAAASWTARNLRRDPRVSLLVDGAHRADAAAVRLSGTASVIDGSPPWQVLLRLGFRYYLDPRSAAVEVAHVRQWRLRARYYGQSDPVWISVKVTRVERLRRPTGSV